MLPVSVSVRHLKSLVYELHYSYTPIMYGPELCMRSYA